MLHYIFIHTNIIYEHLPHTNRLPCILIYCSVDTSYCHDMVFTSCATFLYFSICFLFSMCQTTVNKFTYAMASRWHVFICMWYFTTIASLKGKFLMVGWIVAHVFAHSLRINNTTPHRCYNIDYYLTIDVSLFFIIILAEL